MHIRQLIKIKKLFHLKFPNVFILRKNAGKSMSTDENKNARFCLFIYTYRRLWQFYKLKKAGNECVQWEYV